MTVKKSTRGRASKRSAARAFEPKATAEAVAVSTKKGEFAETEEPLPMSRRNRKGKGLSDLEEANAFASLEIQLRKTVAELGLESARKIFASVEAAFAR